MGRSARERPADARICASRETAAGNEKQKERRGPIG